jgi:hypothetical protein
MYLWKYWRESRITFAVGMLLVGLALWGVLKIPAGSLVQGDPLNERDHPSVLYLLVGGVLTLPLSFVAWQFGSFGVGHDLGAASGSFLFSRPRSRAFFVWSDWGFGITQLLLIVIAANLVLELAVHRAAGASGPLLLYGRPVSFFSVFCLHCAAGLLLTGLIFGLTYFSSVLLKSRGLMLSVGVLLAYLISKAVVKHYDPSINLPDITLTEFSMSGPMGAGFADRLGLAIALRAALALLFPVAAQLLLEQRDID